jgi:DNA repair protein RecO (recombination protein O)
MKIPVYKTEGIIIRRFNFNEFDKLLVVYTKDFGKILVKAKSLRKKEAKMKSQLEIFNYVHLMLAKGKNMDTISGVALENGFPNLRQDLNSLAAAYYICEATNKLITAPERDERIWQLVLKFFYFLEEKPRSAQTIQKLINRFEYNLLTFLGHKPEREKKSYLDIFQYLCGERVEASVFLKEILSWG